MKFFAIISLFSIGALATAVAEPEAYVDAAANNVLERGVDCDDIVPLCCSGVFIQRYACLCPGQAGPCGQWACPYGRVSVHFKLFFFSSLLLQNPRFCLQFYSIFFLSVFLSFLHSSNLEANLILNTANLWLETHRLRMDNHAV